MNSRYRSILHGKIVLLKSGYKEQKGPDQKRRFFHLEIEMQQILDLDQDPGS